MQRHAKRAGILALSLILGLTLLAGLSGTASPARAQVSIATPAPTDPNARITWPPPVYVLRDQVEIIGSAAVPGMTSYFMEFRLLGDDLNPAEDADWIPATLPSTTPVTNGVLGIWNTRIAEDGLYELRLSVNAAGRAVTFFTVGPLRVENAPPPFVVVSTPIPRATATSSVITRPTLPPTPTAFDSRPRVVANTDANVRQGDSVGYPVVGSLLAGQSAELLGISSTGSGWYYILLDTGRRGFIAPSLVRVTGQTTTLQQIVPPATPTPTRTPTPAFTGNLIINGHRLEEAEPRCAVPFQVFANVTNSGAQTTSGAFVVRLEDFDIASGIRTTIQERTVPPLAPGENFVVVFDLTINQFPRADHRIVLTADAYNQIVEENENDNTRIFTYRLRGAGCP